MTEETMTEPMKPSRQVLQAREAQELIEKYAGILAERFGLHVEKLVLLEALQRANLALGVPAEVATHWEREGFAHFLEALVRALEREQIQKSGQK